jgi:uncharacterized UPF0146 family protein
MDTKIIQTLAEYMTKTGAFCSNVTQWMDNAVKVFDQDAEKKTASVSALKTQADTVVDMMCRFKLADGSPLIAGIQDIEEMRSRLMDHSRAVDSLGLVLNSLQQNEEQKRANFEPGRAVESVASKKPLDALQALAVRNGIKLDT